MAELDFDQDLIDSAMGQLDQDPVTRAGGNPRFKGDENLYVRFFYHPHHDPEASVAQGRPIYQDREYVEIIVPGDKTTSVVRPVRDQDKMRFARQYQSFKSNQVQTNFGTPLEAWPGITRAQCEELKYFKIFTVEQLANMPDSIAQRFMGVNSLRARAKDFLEASKGTVQLEQFRKAIEDRDSELEVLRRAIADLQARLPAPGVAATPKLVADMQAMEEVLEDPEDR